MRRGCCRFSGRPRSSFGIEGKPPCARSRVVETLEAHSTARLSILGLPRTKQIRIVLFVFWKRRVMGQSNHSALLNGPLNFWNMIAELIPSERGGLAR